MFVSDRETQMNGVHSVPRIVLLPPGASCFQEKCRLLRGRCPHHQREGERIRKRHRDLSMMLGMGSGAELEYKPLSEDNEEWKIRCAFHASDVTDRSVIVHAALKFAEEIRGIVVPQLLPPSLLMPDSIERNKRGERVGDHQFLEQHVKKVKDSLMAERLRSVYSGMAMLVRRDHHPYTAAQQEADQQAFAALESAPDSKAVKMVNSIYTTVTEAEKKRHKEATLRGMVQHLQNQLQRHITNALDDAWSRDDVRTERLARRLARGSVARLPAFEQYTKYCHRADTSSFTKKLCYFDWCTSDEKEQERDRRHEIQAEKEKLHQSIGDFKVTIKRLKGAGNDFYCIMEDTVERWEAELGELPELGPVPWDKTDTVLEAMPDDDFMDDTDIDSPVIDEDYKCCLRGYLGRPRPAATTTGVAATTGASFLVQQRSTAIASRRLDPTKRNQHWRRGELHGEQKQQQTQQQQPTAAPLQQQPTPVPSQGEQPTLAPPQRPQPAQTPLRQQQPASTPLRQQQPASTPLGQQHMFTPSQRHPQQQEQRQLPAPQQQHQEHQEEAEDDEREEAEDDEREEAEDDEQEDDEEAEAEDDEQEADDDKQRQQQADEEKRQRQRAAIQRQREEEDKYERLREQQEEQQRQHEEELYQQYQERQKQEDEARQVMRAKAKIELERAMVARDAQILRDEERFRQEQAAWMARCEPLAHIAVSSRQKKELSYQPKEQEEDTDDDDPEPDVDFPSQRTRASLRKDVAMEEQRVNKRQCRRTQTPC
jgi:hypothetical protein